MSAWSAMLYERDVLDNSMSLRTTAPFIALMRIFYFNRHTGNREMPYASSKFALMLPILTLAAGCATPRPALDDCAVAPDDIYLGDDPSNDAVLEVAIGKASESDEVAWFQSEDGKRYRLCVLSAEPVKFDRCPDKRPTYEFMRTTSRWGDNDPVVRWVEVSNSYLECVVVPE